MGSLWESKTYSKNTASPLSQKWVLKDYGGLDLSKGIIFQFWNIVTLQRFDLKKPTVPLYKDLDLVVYIVSIQETASIFRIGFALSKWPHFYGAYFIGVCIFFAKAERPDLLQLYEKLSFVSLM